MRDTPRIAVLGAYGSAGKAVIRELLHRRVSDIIAVGRNPAKMDGLLIDLPPDTVSVVLGEMNDPVMLDMLFRDIDVVINCIGPYIENGFALAKRAVAAGVHYIDISAEQEHYRRLKALASDASEKNVIIAPGFGLYPGLSSLFLLDRIERLPKADICRMSLCMEGEAASEVGTASFSGALLEMCYPLEVIRDSKLTAVTPGKKRKVLLPVLDEVKKLNLWPQLEILSMKDIVHLSSFETSLKIGKTQPLSPLLVYLIRLFRPHKSKGMYSILKRLTGLMLKTRKKHQEPGKTPGAMVHLELEASEAAVYGTLIAHSQRATAWLPVQTALKTANSGVSGLVRPDQLFDKEDVFSELLGDGVIEIH